MIASADMDINGPYTGLFGSGLMQLVDGVAWKEHFDSAQGALTLTGNGISIDRIAMVKGTGRMTGRPSSSGTAPIRSARGDQVKVESLDNFKVEQAPLTGLMTFTASGAGAFSAPHYEFGGTIKDLYAADEFVGEVTGHLRVDDNRLTIDQFNTSSFRLQVTGSGQIVLDDQYDAELTLKFLDTSIDPYLKFFAPRMSPYTRAIASGTVRVSGPLADYTHLGVFLTGVEGTLTLFDYQLKNDGPISLTFQDNSVSIGRFRLTGEGTNLELSGGMSVSIRRSTCRPTATPASRFFRARTCTARTRGAPGQRDRIVQRPVDLRLRRHRRRQLSLPGAAAQFHRHRRPGDVRR
jgi:hypothetical protein